MRSRGQRLIPDRAFSGGDGAGSTLRHDGIRTEDLSDMVTGGFVETRIPRSPGASSVILTRPVLGDPPVFGYTGPVVG